jgi:hypothetical protein
MRKAIRPNPGKQPKAQTTQLQAPVKGWSSEDSPMEAEPGTALIIDNWFPDAEGLRLRQGYASYATGMTGEVQSLMTFTSASASKMYAANAGKIYNVTAAGAVGAAEVSGMTNDKWQSVMFANASNQYMFIANGADSVRYTDGSTWTTPSITGVTSSTLIHLHPHKFRMWYVQVNTSDLWYMPINALAGAATKFSVGALFHKGGYVMAVQTWSVDAGDGMDDLFVIWSSEGEVLIYQGTDPSAADTWSLVGVYEMGKPLGRRCMTTVGSDLAMISEDGIVPVSGILKTDRSTASAKALTSRIRQAFADSVHGSRNVYGWQFIVYPIRNMAILNVPLGGGAPTYQYVLNTITGAWTRFTNHEAICWGTLSNSLYFGGYDGVVYQADTGGYDNTEEIAAAVLPAYTHLGIKGRLKHVKMVEVIYSSDVISTAPSVSIAVDYELPTDIASEGTMPSASFTWDVSSWDGTSVFFGYTIYDDWRGTGNIGAVISPWTTLSIDAGAGTEFKYRLTGWTLVYEAGGIL